MIDLLPFDRKHEKLPWSLPNGQIISNETLSESCDNLILYEPQDGKISQKVHDLRQTRRDKYRQV